jgi:hypothetical protein
MLEDKELPLIQTLEEFMPKLWQTKISKLAFEDFEPNPKLKQQKYTLFLSYVESLIKDVKENPIRDAVEIQLDKKPCPKCKTVSTIA